MMKVENLLPILDNLIDNKIEKLTNYVKRSKSSDLYIDHANQEIEILTDIYNTLYSLQLLEVWAEIDPCIKEMLQADSQLSGVIISIRLRSTRENFASITINNFE